MKIIVYRFKSIKISEIFYFVNFFADIFIYIIIRNLLLTTIKNDFTKENNSLQIVQYY